MASLKIALYELIRHKQYATTWEIETEAKNLGYKISNAERRLRELSNAGLIIKDKRDGVIVGYKLPAPVQSQLL